MSLRALIADDNPLFRELIGALLGDAGFACAMVSDGIELVELANQDHFDIIVTDVNMPNMDGLSAVRCLRETPGDRGSIPVVVVSGEESQAIALQLRRLGIAELVQKPFTAVSLVTAVRRAIVNVGCAAPGDRRAANG